MAIDLKKPNNVHFIGIGGIGISAIAKMMIAEGKKVSGSDRSKSEITDELKKEGAKIFIGHAAENVSPKTDMVIYTIAVPADNPELVRARELGIECVTYPEALGQLSKEKTTIAVSGTHGKTTTTAMIAKLLIDAGKDPTVIVGSLLRDTESNFIAGKSQYLVAEACEYRRSFLNLSPKILVITNIDDDHLDYYRDIKDIQSAFKELVEKIPPSGFVVCNKELPYIETVVKNAKCSVVDYELFGDQNLELRVPGQHNISNAAAALAVADILDIPREGAKKSLENFIGTWRRFENKGVTESGVLVYDDYGHHPTEVKATLRGARDLFPEKRLIVVFQPHLYSRTKQHLKKFGKAFGDVDEVILAPIYAAREPNDPSISSELVADEIRKNHGNAIALPSFEEIVKHIARTSRDGDVVITMGAGDVYKVGEEFLKNN